MKKFEKLNVIIANSESEEKIIEKINELVDAVNEMQGESPDSFVKELEEMKGSNSGEFWRVYDQAITDIISRFKGRVKMIK